MSENNCIIPECYLDTCLIEVLLQAGRNLANHQKGNGTVAGKMKAWFADTFCIGIIDEDRKPLDYLKEFDLKISSGKLKLWKHNFLHHYIIQLCPVIESVIIEECVVREISLLDFNLPAETKSLLKTTKTIGSRTDNRFVQLFKTMLRKECESLVQLKKWIDFLKQNKYDTDINLLVDA